MEAFRRHGILWGFAISAWRILRCNPFVYGGFDAVPETIYEWKKRWFSKNDFPKCKSEFSKTD